MNKKKNAVDPGHDQVTTDLPDDTPEPSREDNPPLNYRRCSQLTEASKQ